MKFTEFEHNDNWKIKRFPCSCCLVLPACNDYTICNLLQKNTRKMFNLIQVEKKCPDCGEILNQRVWRMFRCPICNHLFEISNQYKFAWRRES